MFFLGCYYSGRLVRVILRLWRGDQVARDVSAGDQPQVQLMSLAEWLSESPQNKTGR